MRSRRGENIMSKGNRQMLNGNWEDARSAPLTFAICHLPFDISSRPTSSASGLHFVRVRPDLLATAKVRHGELAQEVARAAVREFHHAPVQRVVWLDAARPGR